MNFRPTYVILVIVFLISFKGTAQKTQGTIYMKNGTVKKGLVKRSGLKSVKYRSSKKSKSVKFNFEELERVEILERRGKETFVNLKITAKHEKIVQLVEEGRVNLFSSYDHIFIPSAGAGGTAMGGSSQHLNNLYVKRKEEKLPTHLGSNQLFTKNFKKAASEFFKDCTVLVSKIQNNEYKKRDIQEIVAFYNTECK